MPLDPSKHSRVETWLQEVALAGPPTDSSLCPPSPSSPRVSVQRLWSRILKTKVLGFGRSRNSSDDESGSGEGVFCTAMYRIGDESPPVSIDKMGLEWERRRATRERDVEQLVDPEKMALEKAKAEADADGDGDNVDNISPPSQGSRSSKLARRRERLERAARLLAAAHA